jgi:hypothetical protein
MDSDQSAADQPDNLAERSTLSILLINKLAFKYNLLLAPLASQPCLPSMQKAHRKKEGQNIIAAPLGLALVPVLHGCQWFSAVTAVR